MPGGFDWLQTTSASSCTTSIDLTTDTTYSNTGTNVSQPCKQALYNDIQSSATVFLPIFDCDSTVVGCPGYKSTGANAIYHISGLAGFVPTGYRDLPRRKQFADASARDAFASQVHLRHNLNPKSLLPGDGPQHFDVARLAVTEPEVGSHEDGVGAQAAGQNVMHKLVWR